MRGRARATRTHAQTKVLPRPTHVVEHKRVTYFSRIIYCCRIDGNLGLMGFCMSQDDPLKYFEKMYNYTLYIHVIFLRVGWGRSCRMRMLTVDCT